MSIFNEFLPKLNEISKEYIKNFNDDLEAAFQCFDKFEEDYQNEKNRARENLTKDKNLKTLQSIHEVEDELVKTPENGKPNHRSSSSSTKSTDEAHSSMDSNGQRRGSMKRSKTEVDGISSQEQDKRQKRNASVKAQTNITKQNEETVKILEENNIISMDTPKHGVNVNLTQKLRREEPTEKSRRRRAKEDDKENTEPMAIIPLVQVKQEKISIPLEPMDIELVPVNGEVNQEPNKDEIVMPPPVAPGPKSRKAVQKETSEESADESSGSSRRRTTRTRKQTDTAPPPQVLSSRATRASSRATRQAEEEEQIVPEARPKRTRAKKKPEPEPDSSYADTEKGSQPQENGIGSPAEKPRPKRTRRGQKNIEKEETQKPLDPPEPVEVKLSLKQETITLEETIQSPIIQQKTKVKQINHKKTKDDQVDSQSKINLVEDTTKIFIKQETLQDSSLLRNLVPEETRIIPIDSTVPNGDMDNTVVLPNGVYHHTPETPKVVGYLNEMVVLKKIDRNSVMLDKPETAIMDTIVVIGTDSKPAERLTDDNSLLTDDSDYKDPCTPPNPPPVNQATSAVKEKVQQFEEMASRVTRTKTRAMAKKDEQTENQTPPDKIAKPALSAETLTKMNSLIFNGKATQISSSAIKPRANIVTQTKSFIPSSASKVNGINKAREAEEQKKEKEDARRKKEALLEAKRELQKRKREEKMAAAAASRELAEKERRAAMQAAAKDRMEKQAHADQGKLERLREVERRKQELARKAAETEERRKAEELARQQRLAEEQKRADMARKKQIEEAEAMKKEAALMAREIEKRQKEYIEKQKMKQRMEGDKISTPLKTPGTPGGLPLPPMEPVYMADGFQYLNSNEDEEPIDRPIPAWSTSKMRRQHLYIQARIATHHIDKLFSVREHSPDLREIFPNIERTRLKRTSSAVWRTPPSRLPVLRE